ncbi:MAG: TrmH family RNA methyltransferase [Draconibacterium sp.]|nr:TrmH family RNA methyltransferase [Draconibacterium sp.]
MNTNSVTFFNSHISKPVPDNHELILAVWEIGNPENIGSIIRLAHNVGAQKVLFVNENTNFRESKIKKIAGFSFEQMTWEFIFHKDFLELLNTEYQLYVLETCEGSENIFKTTFPKKTIILAGSESRGLPANIIEISNKQIHIPMPGGCKSMNISHALSVAAFEWYRQKTL